jgi:hypothetical protein
MSDANDANACLAAKPFACPAIDGSRALSSLAPSDAATFCDCLAAYSGGYGTAVACTCSDGSPGGLTAPASQAECLAQPIPTGCSATLTEFQTCVNLLWSRPCDDDAIVAAVANPACQKILARPCPWGG